MEVDSEEQFKPQPSDVDEDTILANQRAPDCSYEKVDDIDRSSFDIASQLSAIAAEVRGMLSQVSLNKYSVSSSAASKLRYKCEGYIDQLMKMLETLDSLESNGDPIFRKRRKDVVLGIQDVISHFESLSRRMAQILGLVTHVPRTTSFAQIQHLNSESAAV